MLKRKRCAYENCLTRPNCNYPTETKALFCGEHKLENMIDIVNKRCAHENCLVQPSYNLPTETKTLFCGEHKLESMINVVSKRCAHDNCLTRPTHNLPTETKSLFCAKHKLENMINIVSKRCAHNNCLKIPIFNCPTETKGLFCGEHKLENMIDIVNKRCAHDNCLTRPNCNYPTETKALFCGEHKLENMIDIKNKRCAHENCLVQPSYNLPTETKTLFCAKHKLENMIDIVHKRCAHDNCLVQPSYNYPTETKGVFCGEHKLENMISVSNKKCQHLKCKDTPLFGLVNKRPQFCLTHKQPNMINVILENKCVVLDCNNDYEHVVEDEKYCNAHIPSEEYGMIVKRLCRYCDILEETAHVCNRCKKVQNKKEWAIVRYLRTAIDTNFEYNSSKMLQGCSKKRPDVYFELAKHCVIVEIDENQHNTYQDSCECSRINEIVNGIGGKPVIIIRYNPDVVRSKGKQLHVSQQERMGLLVETIKTELTREYELFVVKVVQIYYSDGYEEYQPIKEEIITDKVCV